jgi:hypothetical protein
MSRERRERTTPLMMGRVLGQQDSLEVTPERFLSEGEAHEGRGWDDVLPDDDEREQRRHRESVDKVPRRRSAVLGLVVVCICVALGAAIGGFALFSKSSFRSWFEVTSPEPAAVLPPKQTPAQAPRTEPQRTAQPPALPQPRPVAQAQPVAQPRAQPPAPARAPAAVPVAAPKPQNAVVRPDPDGAERLRQDAIAVRRRRQSHAEKDLVWSQELKALVPAEYMEQPPVKPSAAPAR